jgi:hypothetical protein
VGKGRDWVCTLYREEESRGAGIERKGDMGGEEGMYIGSYGEEGHTYSGKGKRLGMYTVQRGREEGGRYREERRYGGEPCTY